MEMAETWPEMKPPLSIKAYRRWEKEQILKETDNKKRGRKAKLAAAAEDMEVDEEKESFTSDSGSEQHESERDIDADDSDHEVEVQPQRSGPPPDPSSSKRLKGRTGTGTPAPCPLCCFCNETTPSVECSRCGTMQTFAHNSEQNKHFRVLFSHRSSAVAAVAVAAAAAAVGPGMGTGTGTNSASTNQYGGQGTHKQTHKGGQGSALNLFEMECRSHMALLGDKPYPMYDRHTLIPEAVEKEEVSEAFESMRRAYGGLRVHVAPTALVELVQSGMLPDMSSAIPFTAEEVRAATLARKPIGTVTVNQISVSDTGMLSAGGGHSTAFASRVLTSSSDWMDALLCTIIPSLIMRPRALMSWCALTKTMIELAKDRPWKEVQAMLKNQMEECIRIRGDLATISNQVLTESIIRMNAGHGIQSKAVLAVNDIDARDFNMSQSAAAAGRSRGAGSNNRSRDRGSQRQGDGPNSVHSGGPTGPSAAGHAYGGGSTYHQQRDVRPLLPPNSGASQSRSDQPCHQYNRGQCQRGADQCRFRHICQTPGCRSTSHVEADCSSRAQGSGATQTRSHKG